MKPDTHTELLQTILDQVWALRPHWEKPEKFHETKSDIVAGLKRLIVESGGSPGNALVASERTTPVSLQPREPAVGPAARTDDALIGDTPVDTSEADPSGSAEDPPEELVQPAAESPPAPIEVGTADLIELQHGIRSVVAAVTDILANVEKLTLSARASVAAYVTALTLPQLPAPGATLPVAVLPVPASPPANVEPQTLYRRSQLLTEAGRVIAVRLWIDGLTKRDIAECFDYQGNGGPACVSAAIATFLHTHYPEEIAVSTGERGKELAQRALLAIDAKPSRSNGHTKPPPPSAAIAVAADTVDPDLAAATLPFAQYQPADLRTSAGQARAAELWAAGYGQRVVGLHFGIQKSCEPQVSLAISAFIREHLGPFHAVGEDRKPLIRAALIKFQESHLAAE